MNVVASSSLLKVGLTVVWVKSEVGEAVVGLKVGLEVGFLDVGVLVGLKVGLDFLGRGLRQFGRGLGCWLRGCRLGGGLGRSLRGCRLGGGLGRV
jgi:hypothetical protein